MILNTLYVGSTNNNNDDDYVDDYDDDDYDDDYNYDDDDDDDDNNGNDDDGVDKTHQTQYKKIFCLRGKLKCKMIPFYGVM